MKRRCGIVSKLSRDGPAEAGVKDEKTQQNEGKKFEKVVKK